MKTKLQTNIFIMIFFLIGICAQVAQAQNVACYTEQGGARMVVGSGCSLDVASSGEIDVESGGALKIAGVSVTATAAELNLASDLSALYEDVTATNVLTVAECGKVLTLNSATEFVSTFPVPTAGCNFDFIVKAAPASASYTIVTNASANVIMGGFTTADINGAADVDWESTGGDTITITDAVAVVGDWVKCVSDGTNWYCRGASQIYNALTITGT